MQQLSQAAMEILKSRYFLKDRDGNFLEKTAADVFHRVANAVAQAEPEEIREEWARKFYEGISSLLWLPNSPTLMNAGTGAGCLSACFQLTPEDDEYDILQTAARMGMVLKYGGGVGIALSKLRPEGSPIRSTHGKAHGPVLALREVFRSVPRLITQGGKRQAANMAILSIRHPDIEKFISVKRDHLPNDVDDPGMALYNISVAIDNEFMKAAESPTSHEAGLLSRITQQAWETGDPGLFFIDRANQDNILLSDEHETESPYYMWGTNPCVTGDTVIATSNGNRKVEDLISKPFIALVQGTPFYCHKGFFPTGIRQTYILSLRGGYRLEATGNHRIRCIITEHNGSQHRGWRELKDLRPGDVVVLNKRPWLAAILEVKPTGKEKAVYDASIQGRYHTYSANGILVHNCGEQSLPHQGACQLASINLASFYKDGNFDTGRFRETIHTVVRFLDDSITVNHYPDPGIAEYAQFSRDIGLGVMGLSDLLANLKVTYGSSDCLALCEQISLCMVTAATEASEQLAQEKGPAPAFTQVAALTKVTPRRNIALCTVAPTGTLSIFCNCVGGIEPPLFKIELRKQGGIQYFSIPPPIKKALKPATLKKLDTLLAESLDDHTKLKSAEAFIDLELPDYIKTAYDIPWQQHLDVVAAFQKYIDRSISKTINFPTGTTWEEVHQSAIYAFKAGLKGWTVYRDGSIPSQPYTGSSTLEKQRETEQTGLFEVPERCEGMIHRIKVDLGEQQVEYVYIMVGFVPGTKKPFQVFVTSRLEDLNPIVKQMITLTTRLVSTALRARAPLAEVIKQLEKVEGQYMYSIPLSIAKVLHNYLDAAAKTNGITCPVCKAKAYRAEGCEHCTSCGWTKCSG